MRVARERELATLDEKSTISVTGIITRAQTALQTSSKTNARENTTAKFNTFSNYPPFGNDANFDNYPDAEDVKVQPKSQDYLLQIQYFCNFSLVLLSIHPRSRRGAQRIRKGEGRLSRPPKTFTCSFKPFRRQAKQTNAQALQTSSK